MDDARLLYEFPNTLRLRFIEIEFRDITGVEIHARLPVPVFFNERGAVADHGHSGPELPHRRKDLRFLRGRNARRFTQRAQFGYRFAPAFYYDYAPFLGFADEFRSAYVEFAYRGFPHVLHCSNSGGLTAAGKAMECPGVPTI